MELYVLDNLLRRIEVIDKFESLIWTERWQDVGDFELDIIANLETRTLLYPGNRIAVNESDRVMVIEQVEDSNVDGERMLKVRGRSLEIILENRAALQTLLDITEDPTWVLEGTPVSVAEGMFDYICRSSPFPPALDPGDAIPFLQAGSLYSQGTIPEPTETIWWEQRPDHLLNAMRDICKSYDLGFRLVRNADTSELYFDVYAGNDLTTGQSTLPPVIFSPVLDNYHNIKEFNSSRGVKNVAYVRSRLGVRTVYAPGYDSTVDGFDRKVMYLDANLSVDDPPTNVQDALEQIGLEELSKQQGVALFDGEVSERNSYIYGVDYTVGDLVEVRNGQGETSNKRVVEQIFVHDRNGQRSHPTLMFGISTNLVDWLSYSSDDTVWSEMTTEVWEDM